MTRTLELPDYIEVATGAYPNYSCSECSMTSARFANEPAAKLAALRHAEIRHPATSAPVVQLVPEQRGARDVAQSVVHEQAAYREGWRDAWDYYGTTDEDTGVEHGPSCRATDGYICVCDDKEPPSGYGPQGSPDTAVVDAKLLARLYRIEILASQLVNKARDSQRRGNENMNLGGILGSEFKGSRITGLASEFPKKEE